MGPTETVTKLVTTAGTNIGAGVVPAGMKRWVTFIRATNEYGGVQKIYICSATSAVYATTVTRASATCKVKFLLDALAHENLPERGPTDHRYPLFSIAENKYLNAYPDQGNASLFIQYYDNAISPAKSKSSGARAWGVKPYTYIFDRTDYTPITQTVKLLEVEDKSGEIQEFVIKSASSNYSIELNIDGQKTRFYKTWTELSAMAEDINGIVAVHRNGEYLVNLTGMFFSQSIYLAVIADRLTFTMVYLRVKYDG